MSNNEKIESTDVGGDAKPKHVRGKPGQGASNKRNEAYRRKKNKETDDAIMAGIFSRLKIADPTSVPQVQIARDIHPVTVPISLRQTVQVVDRVWDTMEAIGTRPFANLNTLENKNIFKKGMLILEEAKVCYAQRAHMDKPDEDLPSKNLYSLEELQDLNNMAEELPLPLAMLLETIGNTVSGKQTVTPLLAEVQGMANVSGAVTYAPRQLLPLLRILRGGVPLGGQVHNVAIALADLPGLVWEEFVGPVVAPALEGAAMVRLNDVSAAFWLTGNNGREKIRWTDAEYRIFRKIVQSLSSKKDFNVKTDLSHGQGSLAQIVRTPDWQVDQSIEWFTMDDCTDYDQKLGVAFGFGYFGDCQVQPSRFTGSYVTAYWRGELTPRRVLTALVANAE